MMAASEKQLSWQQSANIIMAVVFIVLILAVIFVITLIILMFAVAGRDPSSMWDMEVKGFGVVRTGCGYYKGFYNNDSQVFTFKGIRYAEPPVGKLRWQRPQPLGGARCRITQIHEAIETPPSCPQMSPYVPNDVEGEEDCLFLNIYTPLDLDNPLPVMVWIHGGFLQTGSASDPTSSPDDRLVNTLRVVHVSVSYRLGALGFLVLDALPGDGNYGIWDQLEALRWVSNNIANFGGDPKQVTVWGHGSGATCTWALMMSPHVRGLIHRAILLSPSPVLEHPLEQARKDNTHVLMEQDGVLTQMCGQQVTQQCLRDMEYKDVVRSVYPYWNLKVDKFDLPIQGQTQPALIVIDGDLLPQNPMEALAQKTGQYSDIPLIISTSAQEVDLDPTPGQNLKNWTLDVYTDYVSSKLRTFNSTIAKKAMSLYPWKHDAEYVFTSMTSDLRINCPCDVMAERAAMTLTSPVYRCIITSWPSQQLYSYKWKPKYAFHGWDTLAIFDVFSKFLSPAKSDSDFRDSFHDFVRSFVHHGTPDKGTWHTYPNMTALVSDRPQYARHYHLEQCHFWTNYGFWQYGWSN